VGDQTTQQVHAEIELAREATLTSLDQVRRELVEVVDWRTYYRRHPWGWIAVAAGLGILIGHRTRRR